jgi:ZIP family zinc transporter
LAIVLGSVLDGIPESFVLGLTVLQGGVSLSLLAGVALSNLPEGMPSSAGLKQAGWPQRRVLWMWSAVVLVSALSAAAGYVLLDPAGRATGALVQAFAGGALLAMLADTLLPEAYKVEGMWTGSLVVAGSRSPWRCRRSSKCRGGVTASWLPDSGRNACPARRAG